MGKELWTGRNVLKRFFREFFLRIVDEGKDTRSFLSFGKQQKEQDTYSPRIILFHGENGLGKSSTVAQCISLAQDIGTECKKQVRTILFDFEEIFFEKGYIPISKKEFLDLFLSRALQADSSISEYFSKYKEFGEKISRIQSHVDLIMREEWPLESQNGFDEEEVDLTEIENKQVSWLQKKLPKQDLDLLSNVEKKLSEIIINGLIQVSQESPLLLCFDAYEYLPQEIEQWFRTEIIAAVHEQKNRIISLVSGFGNIARKFRNDFSEDILYIFNFDDLTLTRTDIARIASKSHVNVTDTEVIQIESSSAGIPLAVLDIINHLKNGIPAPELIDNSQRDIWSASEVVSEVATRFLSNCRDTIARQRIFYLVMQDQFNPKVLAELWGVQFSDVNNILSDLSKNFMFISGKQVHSFVRYYYRNYLLEECTKQDSELKPLFDAYKDTCSNLLTEQMNNLQSAVPSFEKRYTDERYTSSILNLIGSYMWTSPDEALMLLSGIYIELFHFNPDFAFQVLIRLSEYQSILTENQLGIIDLLSSGLAFSGKDSLRNHSVVSEQETALIQYLEGCKESMSPFQCALLSKMTGELDFRMDNYQNAMDLFQKGLELIDENASERVTFYDDFILLGYGFKACNELPSAVTSFTYASSVRKDSFLPLYESGLLKIALAEFDEAISILIESVKINPDHQDAWYNLGLGYSALHEYETAVQSFAKAVEKGPQNQVIWFEMGKALNQLQKHEDAVKAFAKVVEENPAHYEAWFIAGQSYSALGCADDAIAAFQKAIGVKPDLLEAQKALALEFYNKKDFVASAESYKRAVALDEQDATLWGNLAKAWLGAEMYDKAIEAGKSSVSLAPKELDSWMTLGSAYTAISNYPEAINSFTKASAISPGNAVIWNHVGNSYLSQGLYDDAIQAFSTAVKLNPSIEGSWYNIGRAYTSQEKFEDATFAFQKSTEVEPENPDCWFEYAESKMKLEQFSDAVEHYTKATSLKPDSHNLWYQRGHACLKISDFNEAIISFVKAAEILPSDTDNWYYMGVSYSAAGHFQEAVQAFQQAVDLDKDRAEIWYEMGIAKQELGLFDEAIESLKLTVQIVPEQTDAWTRIGICHYYLQRYEESITTLRKALTLEPANLEIIHYLGLASHAKGDLDDAIEYYRQITERDPEASDAWFNMALALHAKDDLDNAIQVYNRTVSKWPENGDAWYNLGLAYHSKEDQNKAIWAYRQASKINPDNPEIWYQLGIAFHSLEHYGEAIQAYRKVVQLSPDSSDAWFNLGLSYFVWGQYDDAIESYEKTIELKPDNYVAAGNLTITYVSAEMYDKAIETGNKTLEFLDEPWIRSSLVLSYTMTGNSDMALEHASAMTQMESSAEEIAKTVGQLQKAMIKNPELQHAQLVIDKLSEESIEISNS